LPKDTPHFAQETEQVILWERCFSMSLFVWAFIFILMSAFITCEQGRASGESQCANYSILFDKLPEKIPGSVYLNKAPIGTVVSTSSGQDASGNVSVCIDKKFARHIDSGTICYISGDKIYLYNIWATGEKLNENSVIPGFSSNLRLFMHEVKLLLSTLLRPLIPKDQ
jgi:hypothetical protein